MDAIKSSIKEVDIKVINVQEQIQSYEGSLSDLDSILNELSISQECSFNDKQDIIKKYVKDITLYYLDSHYYIDISFTIPNMDSVIYVMDKGYNYAYRLIYLKTMIEVSKNASKSFRIDTDAIVWNDEYKDIDSWLTFDVLANSLKVFNKEKID